MSLDDIAQAIQAYQACASAYDQWEHGGKASATGAQIAAMDAELAQYKAKADAARAALGRRSPADQAQFRAKYPGLA